MATLCLDRGAEVDRASAVRDRCETPFLVACSHGHLDVATLCLDRGADVDRPQRDGATALQAACENGDADAVQLCLDRGAAVNRATHGRGATPLYEACLEGHADIVQLLLDRGAEGRPRDRPLDDDSTAHSVQQRLP